VIVGAKNLEFAVNEADTMLKQHTGVLQDARPETKMPGKLAQIVEWRGEIVANVLQHVVES
jgi:hypothetical protein